MRSLYENEQTCKSFCDNAYENTNEKNSTDEQNQDDEPDSNGKSDPSDSATPASDETEKFYKVTGNVNGSDVIKLREQINLASLNLENASIVSGGEPYCQSDGKHYETKDNEIGQRMFMFMHLYRSPFWGDTPLLQPRTFMFMQRLLKLTKITVPGLQNPLAEL